MNKKINSISVTATAVIVFVTWKIIDDIDLSIIQNKSLQFIVKIFIEAVFATGFFNLVIEGVTYLSNKVNWLKKIVLGSSYIDGVWVGFYRRSRKEGDPLEPIIFYERVEQTVNLVSFTGRACYLKDWSFRSRYTGESVTFYNENSTIVYIFNANIPDAMQVTAFGNFTVDRFTKDSAPYRMEGYCLNIGESCWQKYVKVKLSDDYQKKERQDIFRKAIEIYEKETGDTVELPSIFES
ncbi:hypothetical protein FACS1894111_11400 [Clostridia bacterium]|nr:hypothetical protein FACS1894111_11400 [Clostridia bacterium]